MNQHPKYLGQRSFSLKVTVRTHRHAHIHSHIGPTALSGPLMWSRTEDSKNNYKSHHSKSHWPFCGCVTYLQLPVQVCFSYMLRQGWFSNFTFTYFLLWLWIWPMILIYGRNTDRLKINPGQRSWCLKIIVGLTDTHTHTYSGPDLLHNVDYHMVRNN